MLHKAPSQCLTARQQTVVGVRERKQRKKGEGLSATGAATATDPDPVVVCIVRLLAAASMADDRIAFTSGTSTQDNFGATRGPLRFDHRPWTPPQASARCIPRLDQDPSRSLPRLRKDLHLSSAAFSPLHPLQFADALSGIATALCGALLLGRGHAYAPRPESPTRFFHAPSLGPRSGLLPTGSFFSPPNAHPRHSLVGIR